MTEMKQPLDHLKSSKRPVRRTVYIAHDSELAEEVARLEEDVRQLRSRLELRPDASATERLSSMEEELEARRGELEQNAIKFVFQSIRRRRYDELVTEHPPTEAQLEEAGEQRAELTFNPDTFPVALIIECMVEPELLDAAQRSEMAEWLESEAWNSTELMTLFQACIMVNNTTKLVSMGKG